MATSKNERKNLQFFFNVQTFQGPVLSTKSGNRSSTFSTCYSTLNKASIILLLFLFINLNTPTITVSLHLVNVMLHKFKMRITASFTTVLKQIQNIPSSYPLSVDILSITGRKIYDLLFFGYSGRVRKMFILIMLEMLIDWGRGKQLVKLDVGVG